MFLRDVGHAPSDLHSIDRFPDNAGHYVPGNVRWALPLEQANNTRANHRVTFHGETRTVAEWERHLRLPPGRVKWRLRHGWSVERALTTPVRPHR